MVDDLRDVFVIQHGLEVEILLSYVGDQANNDNRQQLEELIIKWALFRFILWPFIEDHINDVVVGA